MESKELIESFSEFARQRNIDRLTEMRILEDVFRAIIKKQYQDDSNFDVIINIDKGDLEIWRYRTVVDDDSEDIWDFDKIPLAEAHAIDSSLEVDEELAEEVKLSSFGRRDVQTIRQTLIQKVKDLEKEKRFNAYKNRVGDLVTGIVAMINSREVTLTDGENNDLILPRYEQIQKDRFRKDEPVRAVVHRVEMVNGSPRIILSRTSPTFLERLFEQEVPEITDGLIGIKKIVREPGERAKVAVESFDDRIDPVGACVGMKGSRIHSIVRELENENIDVINYTSNMELFIARALSPAKIGSIKINHNDKRVSVFLKPDQVSLAIGKGGQNIKLAGKLVGMEIDVFRESEGIEAEDDIALEEFDDEIDVWMIDELKRIGLDTARSVLNNTVNDLVRRTELEEEHVIEIMDILKREFEDVAAEAKAEAEAKANESQEASEDATPEAPAETPAEVVAEAEVSEPAEAPATDEEPKA
jgi:N utilization substance protein A